MKNPFEHTNLRPDHLSNEDVNEIIQLIGDPKLSGDEYLEHFVITHTVKTEENSEGNEVRTFIPTNKHIYVANEEGVFSTMDTVDYLRQKLEEYSRDEN